MIAVGGVSLWLGWVGDVLSRSYGRNRERVVRSARACFTRLQSKGYASSIGQNGAPTHPAAQLQLFAVSLSTTQSYEPTKSPFPRPRLPT